VPFSVKRTVKNLLKPSQENKEGASVQSQLFFAKKSLTKTKIIIVMVKPTVGFPFFRGVSF
jgi:hypothetical protein